MAVIIETTMAIIIKRSALLLLAFFTAASAISAPIHWYVGIEAMAEELYGPLEDIFANPSPCTFRFPPGCDSSTCIFLGKWRSEQLSTGGIVVHFLIASLALGPNRWLGVGFSADRNMPHSDSIIAGMDTSGQRLYVSDRWISGYSSPVKDHVDNIINWEWKQESNMTIFYFVRRADTGDYDQDVDLFTDMQRCLFFHFPYSGGEYSEVTDTIGKHYVTPVTIGPICSDRCEDIPSDFELVHGYCAEDFIHPANPLAPVSIADCLTLCQRLSNCLSGAYNADNSRCLLRTSTCSLSRAVDIGRNWYTYNKKSALMGPQNLGGYGPGSLPPWAVPLYPGGPTPLTLPPFPLFPPIPGPKSPLAVPEGETLESTSSETESSEKSGLDVTPPSVLPSLGLNETNETTDFVVSVVDMNETLETETTRGESASTTAATDAFGEPTATTTTTTTPTQPPTQPETAPIDIFPTPDWGHVDTHIFERPDYAELPEIHVPEHVEERHQPETNEPYFVMETEATPIAAQAIVEVPGVVEAGYQPLPPPPAIPDLPSDHDHVLIVDNFEDTGTHCKGSALTAVPENWDVSKCAHECMQRPDCIGFTVDKTRTAPPFLCILKGKGCTTVGLHNMWTFYRRIETTHHHILPHNPQGYEPSGREEYARSNQEVASSSVVEEAAPLMHFADTGVHCKGSSIDGQFLDLSTEQCAKECLGNTDCGGFTFDKTAVGANFRCLLKHATCERVGPHSLWTFYEKIDSPVQHQPEAFGNSLPEPRAATSNWPQETLPSTSDESRRIFDKYFKGVDGNCEGTPIVSLPVPNRESCATECYNNPKCLGFSVQVMREQPPLECQLNAQRCWHPHFDGMFKFYNRAEEMVSPPDSSFSASLSSHDNRIGNNSGPGNNQQFVVHDGMCLDQTGEFWVDNKAQCADRCLVDTNCQGFSYIANGNMCRLIFSFDCNGATIFRRLAEPAVPVVPESHMANLAPRCNLPPDTGPCKANLRRWFYNSNQCEEFVYGGCEGNDNNFFSLEECEQNCSPIGPPSAARSHYGMAPPTNVQPQELLSNYPPMPEAASPIEVSSEVMGGVVTSSEDNESVIGFKSLDGNCPGNVLQEVFQPVDVKECAERCTQEAQCAGFAYAKDDMKCVLKDGPCKSPYPHKFIYYAKL